MVVSVTGDPEAAAAVLRATPEVGSVAVRGAELTVETADGSRLMGRAAVALSEAGFGVESPVHRTPTLDDVFMSMTCEHLGVEV